jgi:signal transduction histidine kinase
VNAELDIELARTRKPDLILMDVQLSGIDGLEATRIIIVFTEPVLDDKFGKLNEAQHEYLRDLLQSSRHLLSFIKDILDNSKIEAEKMELIPTSIDVR